MTPPQVSRPTPHSLPGSGRGRDRVVRVVAMAVGAGLAMVAGLALGPEVAPPDPSRALEDARLIAAANGVENGITQTAQSVSGKGEFADLTVTVGQTKELVNQSVTVTWAWGGANPGQHETIRNGTTMVANYLQIMQCWGDAAPDRSQCEYGGFTSLQETGATFTASRRIFPPSSPPGGSQPLDPLEVGISGDDAADADFFYQGDQPGPKTRFAVPFRTVAGETFKHDGAAINPFYSEFETNEIPQAATRGDGKGFETFELQTFRESAGLGCADLLTVGPKRGSPRSCWLVVVPRGTTEVDGKPFTAYGSPAQLQSSPLSLTNWNQRLEFSLVFAPIGQPCPISAKQRLVGGVETSAEAVLRWQPALCRGGGAVYGFSKLADAVAEGPLTGNASNRGLSFLNAPVDPAAVPTDRTLVYAPLAISGVSIAALVERSPKGGAPDSVERRRGERMTDLKLTPRLVAKLLTQSYAAAVDSTPIPGYIAGNPKNIDEDPEFLALNPEFADLTGGSIQMVLPTGVSFTTQTLWRWIETDPEARDFVAGVPDRFGMRVNPFYQGLDLPQETLPKIDPYCRQDPNPDVLPLVPPLCVFDLHPAVADFRESARQVGRGDPLSLIFASKPKAAPTDPDYIRAPRQPPGGRQLLGVTDTATAARFQLTAVKLRNAAGAFVAPTEASMQAAAASMRPSAVSGVLSPDPETTNRTAYPLTVITYAASAPNQLTAEAARDYATFVRFAAGPGQRLGEGAGTLPAGYAPLPAAMRSQALRAAADIQARVGPRPAPQPSTPPPAPEPSVGASASTTPPPAATPSAAPSVPPSTSTPAPTITQAVAAARTPADSLVNRFSRYAMIAALLLGSGGLLIAPLLPRIAERLRR